jgi:hypothetical protein
VIPAAVSYQMVRAELEVAAAFAAAAGVLLEAGDLSEENLRFYAIVSNANGEPFFAEFDCREYPLHPPTIEFLDADRQARGLGQLYPNCFHSMPCICARYNRKAYQESGGPHGDWRLVDWHLPTPGGGTIDSLAMILSDLQSKVGHSTGRLG